MDGRTHHAQATFLRGRRHAGGDVEDDFGGGTGEVGGGAAVLWSVEAAIEALVGGQLHVPHQSPHEPLKLH